MKKTLFDISHNVFYEIAQSTIDEIDFRTSDKIEFPIIEKTPKCRVTVPKPQSVNGIYFFEGCVFDNYDENYETIWSLYLATVSHMAVHAKISDYIKYESWIKNKTVEKCQRVIDFVEDIRVEEYLKKSFPDTWQNLASIKTTLDDLKNKKISKRSSEIFYNSYSIQQSNEIQKLREKLSQIEGIEMDIEIDEIVPFLDFFYKNQDQLPKYGLAYCMEHDGSTSQKDFLRNVKIKPQGMFARIVAEIDDIWIKEKRRDQKSLNDYKKLMEGSHFDEVVVGSENLAEFTRLAKQSVGILKKVRTALKTITNIIDVPRTDDIGLLNLQLAIQQEASKNPDIQFQEQDDPRKMTENWLVIIDASASMVSKFEDMKKMALCISEAAEVLNQGKGKWGLYGFNNNFIVVKDHVEQYNLQTKARLGGIENNGLSLIPDAVNMGIKILNRDTESQRKYLILISDGKSFGYDDIDDDFKKSLQSARKRNINLIGVGIPKNLAKHFSIAINGDDPGKSLERFMGAYTRLTQTME